jgi:hypothetical protein
VKLVQMPTDLLHLDDADLPAAGVDPGLLAAFRAYLPGALDDARGVALLAPPAAGTRELLMVLARRIGAALRDDNIRLRTGGGDLASGRKKLCYLPGDALAAALASRDARRTLAGEAACFFQDLETIGGVGEAGPAGGAPTALLDLLDQRLASGRPTFLSAAPDQLPDDLVAALRARLKILEPRPAAG